jgi:hypothetical protein
MKKKIKALVKTIHQIINLLGIIGIIAFTIMYAGVFISQIIRGSVASSLAIFMIVLSIMISCAVMEARSSYKKEIAAKDLYKEYRIKVTAAAFLFMNKGQLTSGELKRFMSIMRYTARENDWEEVGNGDEE